MDFRKPLAALWFGLASATVGLGQDEPDRGSTAYAGVATRPRPNMTRQADFYIPFQLADNGENKPVQVRLYVSKDQGAKWKLYQRQPPRAARFQFHAEQDGEYWFAVRTVDRHGGLAGPDQWRPELIVVVDRQPPHLELRVETDDQGNVRADWTAQDPNLAAHTFRLQYQNIEAGTWETVSVELPDADDWRQQWQQQAEWWLQPTGSEILVRVEIMDRAGNATLANKSVRIARVAQRELAEEGGYGILASTTDAASGVDLDATDSFGAATSSTQEQLLDEGPNVAETARAPSPDPTPAVRDFETARSLENTRDFETPATNSPRWISSEPPGLAGAIDDQPIPSRVAPPVANRYVPPVEGLEDVGQRPRITSSPEFDLAYDLYDVGPNGASLVDLWYTRDQGNTWERYGSDDDKESPITVRLAREGLYGFRLVVYSLDAPEPRPPQDGEPADIWVGLDWTKPTGRILSARYGEGVHNSSLIISWQAEDALLSERPITLNFRETPGGPWIPIAAQLPNSGSYTWRLDQRAPPLLYLQLEVRDLAGNVTTHQFERPIVTQGHAPKGRIRDLRPRR